ncbi:MAG: sigma-54-dependent transcriptional regulator [Pseudomonadota bacterium]
MTAPVFVVDDDADHLAALCDLIGAGGHRARAFAGAAEALAATTTETPAAVLTDLRMPGMDGFALVEALRTADPDLPVIVLTGHGDVAHAVRAIRAGAEDFLEKPYDAAHLLAVLDRALRSRAARSEIARLQSVVQERAGAAILGESAAIVALRARIDALAPLAVDVVVTGETGTGKELVARALHRGSPRAAGPLVALNCAALSEAHFETEVFGHAEGAFPGAGPARAGKLEAASGGTLVLDEIEAMPPAVQAKFLRALEERAVERLGENRLRPLDLRVVAVSKADLLAQVQAGAFRADLYYRLAGAAIETPPLRAMGEDALLIFAHYAALAARRYGGPVPPMDPARRQAILRRAWPGNVRELRLAAERQVLGIETVGPAADLADRPGTLAERVAQFEAREIAAALERARGNTERAATALGMARRTLNDKMARYGLKS